MLLFVLASLSFLCLLSLLLSLLFIRYCLFSLSCSAVVIVVVIIVYSAFFSSIILVDSFIVVCHSCHYLFVVCCLSLLLLLLLLSLSVCYCRDTGCPWFDHYPFFGVVFGRCFFVCCFLAMPFRHFYGHAEVKQAHLISRNSDE